MSGLVQIVPPEGEPVSLSEAILYARYEEGGIEDSLFNALIRIGVEQTEIITEHQLNTATWTQFFNGWPGSHLLLLSKPPLQSVTSVVYIDQDDIEQTVDASDYIVHTESEHRGFIQFNDEFVFPELKRELINTVKVTFVAGYEAWPPDFPDVQGVPESLKDAIKIFVNDTWSHREFELDGKITGSLQNNKIAMQILKSYRVMTPAGIGIASNIPQFIR